MFDLNFNSFENLYVIDACNLGNTSHFINHSCYSGCVGQYGLIVSTRRANLLMLAALFATRDVEAEEEMQPAPTSQPVSRSPGTRMT